MQTRRRYGTIGIVVLFTGAIGCAPGPDGEAGPPDDGGSHVSQDPRETDILGDDVLPAYCGPNDGTWQAPPAPTGSMACPSDKNLEGCPCPEPDATAPCWPGKRIHRGRGICQDGVTTCVAEGEFSFHWGPCEGAVLPVEGATKGAAACTCFSRGQWQLRNVVPCFVGDNKGNTLGLVSTYLDADGQARCPAGEFQRPGEPPVPQPGEPFSTSELTVDCAGQFKLCLTLKAGDVTAPQPDDCILAHVCTETWYGENDVTQALPPLPAWTTGDTACVDRFAQAGYMELSVEGTSMLCEEISDQGKPLVFQRANYCPEICSHEPSRPECQNCGNGADGFF